ncbi:hypothetical protein E4T56_gene14866, partial [Termitomyces sp. T112]
ALGQQIGDGVKMAARARAPCPAMDQHDTHTARPGLGRTEDVDQQVALTHRFVNAVGQDLLAGLGPDCGPGDAGILRAILSKAARDAVAFINLMRLDRDAEGGKGQEKETGVKTQESSPVALKKAEAADATRTDGLLSCPDN